MAETSMRRFRLCSHGVASALVAATIMLALPETAHAGSGSRLALDLDYANGIDEPAVNGGKGLALRYGYKLDLLVLALTPEVGLGGYWFGGEQTEPRLLNGFLGGKVSFGKVLEPGLFAHVGYGSFKAFDESRGGTTVDAGISLDLTMVPFIDFGVHGAYNAMLIKDAEAFDWFRVGAHAALAF
ncbi:MAG: hypothetical protein ACOY0T_07595 [Myxococcota bacterium]